MEANIILGVIAFIAITLAYGKHLAQEKDNKNGYCKL